MLRKIAWKNIIYKPLNTALCVSLLLFGVGIISLLFLIQHQLEQKFDRDLKDIDLVVGAKGSPLQLVLSAVYHLDAPTGNIKLAEARKIMEAPIVKEAIPLAYGDSYRGYRILGTTEAYIKKYDAQFREGRLFAKSLEATIGSDIAEKTGLKMGDTFLGTHGDVQGGDVHDEHPYTVVGILEKTNTVIDQLVLTNLESVWEVHAHEEEHDHEDEHAHEDEHEHEDEHAHEDEHEHEDEHAHEEEHEHEDEHAHEDEHEHEDEHAHEDEHEHEDEHAHEDEHEHEDEHAHDEDEHEHEDGHAHEDEHEDEHAHEDEHDHEEEHEHSASTIEADSMEITAILLQYKSKMSVLNMPRIINEQTNMQAVLPALEINRLFYMLGIGATTMKLIAWGIMLMAGFSVFFVLYNRLRERKFELALMRTVGYRPWQLFGLLVLEGLLLAIVGYVLGWLFSRVGVYMVNQQAEGDFNFHFSSAWIGGEAWLFLLTILVGIGAALLPAWQAMRIDISAVLSEN